MAKAASPHIYEHTDYRPKMDHKKALKDFNEAIEISGKGNPLYLCNKGIVLYTLSKKEEGLNCFKMAVAMDLHQCKTLTKQNINFIKNPLKAFAKLEEKFMEVKPQFLTSQQIDKVQNAYNDLIELFISFMIKQENTNRVVETGLEELNQQMKQVETELVQVQENMQIMEKNLKKIEADIENNKKNLIGAVTKEEFDRLVSESELTYKMFDNNFRLLVSEVNGVNQWLYNIDETLIKANVFLEAKTNEKFESLKKECGEDVYKYATKFYWTLSNLLHAFKMISTDYISIQGFKYTGIVKMISEVLGAAGKKLNFLPLSFAGGIINILNSSYDAFAKVKLDRKAKKVDDILPGSLIGKDTSLAILNSAIKIAKAKEQTIKELATNESGRSLKERLKDEYDKLASKITKIMGVPQCKVRKMAVRDVLRFIKMSIKLGESSEDIGKLKKEVDELLKDEVAVEHFKELYDKLSMYPRDLSI